MQASQNAQTSTCNPVLTLGGRVRPRTTLVVLAVAALATGLFFGWSSLAALGLTTFIVSFLPCLAMCVLGICAARIGRKPVVPSDEANQKETT